MTRTEPNPARRRWFKATTTDLTGPHYGGLIYLPGTTHRLGINDPFDATPQGWCTAGLYVASHRRVAARWGPVVVEVWKDADAPLVKTTKDHRPTGVPSGVDTGSYAKYRTTGFQVLRIIGVVGYGDTWEGDIYATTKSMDAAVDVMNQLNLTLERNGFQPVTFTGISLQKLRDDRYQLWEITDPNAVPAPKKRRQVKPRVKPRVKHRVEVEFEASRQLTEAEFMDGFKKLDLLIYDGSQRIVGMR